MAAPATRERLTRDRIVDVAVALARQDGPSALSMRRIAQELDVWPMSLYRHFRDKDELLDALAERAAEGLAAPPGAPGGDWRDEARALLHQARTAFERHPGGGRLHREPALRDAGPAILARAGLKPKEAAMAWDALVAYAAGGASTDLPPASFDYGLERLFDGLERQQAASASA